MKNVFECRKENGKTIYDDRVLVIQLNTPEDFENVPNNLSTFPKVFPLLLGGSAMAYRYFKKCCRFLEKKAPIKYINSAWCYGRFDGIEGGHVDFWTVRIELPEEVFRK